MLNKYVSICLLATLIGPNIARANPEESNRGSEVFGNRWREWSRKGAQLGTATGACAGFVWGTANAANIFETPQRLKVNGNYDKSYYYPISSFVISESTTDSDQTIHSGTLSLPLSSTAFIPALGSTTGALGGVVGGFYGAILGGIAGAATDLGIHGAVYLSQLRKSLQNWHRSYRHSRQETAAKKDSDQFVEEVKRYTSVREAFMLPQEKEDYRREKLVFWPYSGTMEYIPMSQADLDFNYLIFRYNQDSTKTEKTHSELVKTYLDQRSFEPSQLNNLTEIELDLIHRYNVASSLGQMLPKTVPASPSTACSSHRESIREGSVHEDVDVDEDKGTLTDEDHCYEKVGSEGSLDKSHEF